MTTLGSKRFFHRHYFYFISFFSVLICTGVLLIAQALESAYAGHVTVYSLGSSPVASSSGNFGTSFVFFVSLFSNLAKTMPPVLTGLLMHLFERQKQRYIDYRSVEQLVASIKRELLFIYDASGYSMALKRAVEGKDDFLAFKKFYEDIIKLGTFTDVSDLSKEASIGSIFAVPTKGIRLVMQKKDFVFRNGTTLSVSDGELRFLVSGSFYNYPKMKEARILCFDQMYDAFGVRYEMLCIENIMKSYMPDLLGLSVEGEGFVAYQNAGTTISKICPEINSLIVEVYGVTKEIWLLAKSFGDVYSDALKNKLFFGADYLDRYVSFIEEIDRKHHVFSEKRNAFFAMLEKDFGL